MDKRVQSKKNRFLKITTENENYNQYWFSESNIDFFINQVLKHGCNRIGFIATPSVFFSLDNEYKEKSYMFDIDEKLTKRHKNAITYDFNDNKYEEKFPNLKHTFDYLIIDPPFITEEAWSKFAEFAKYLSNENGCKIIACSISENKEKLEKLLNLKIKKYQPSIPHLVYQYNIYANYDDEDLDKHNPEIDSN